eukprot:6801087-Prymnesium_polylepis.1
MRRPAGAGQTHVYFHSPRQISVRFQFFFSENLRNANPPPHPRRCQRRTPTARNGETAGIKLTPKSPTDQPWTRNQRPRPLATRARGCVGRPGHNPDT